jgi:cyclopropane-fatty-acyl-phospholipid synthase
MNTAHSITSPITTDAPEAVVPPAAWNRFLKEGLFGLGEDYIKGDWHVERLDELIVHLITHYAHTQSKWNVRLLAYLAHSLLFNPQSGRGAFVVGERHYDLGNDLFRAMLDSSMSYTCGVWRGAQSLEEAQCAKLRTICEKLELAPGMRVLDIGCGWGNFAELAAREYGAHVVGLTISKEQAQFARERCKDLPVEIRLQDYRGFSEQVDRVVSIEMIEAVGRKNLGRFYHTVARSLPPGGVFVLQAISAESFNSRSSVFLDQYVLWLLRHIFPNGSLPRPDDLNGPLTKGLFVEHKESFAQDYARTLLAWRENFDRNWFALKGRYNERFWRIWQYYLQGCRAFFLAGLCNVYQLKYRKL